MLSITAGDVSESNHNNKKKKKKNTATDIKTCTNNRTMEEVWNDINLASLNDHNTPPTTAASNFRNMILQDFLGRPFRTRGVPISMASSTTETDSTLCGTSISTLPTPATVLSLTSAPKINFPNTREPTVPKEMQIVQSDKPTSISNPFEGVAPDFDFPCFSRKRFAESESIPGELRKKRSIKNRESAARSRARKQAYTNELELEVNRLLEENAQLRKQQQQLHLSAEVSSHQHTKKPSLQRSSTF